MPALFICDLAPAAASAEDSVAIAAGKADEKNPEQAVAAVPVAAGTKDSVPAAAEGKQKQKNQQGIASAVVIASASAVCSS